jgi:glycosyltransferase involved in cell wall biosynthesis
MTKGLELSVIIETLNYERGDEEILGLVLAALGQQTMARREIEIIVVVDPDRDREMGAHLLAMDGALRIIEAPGAHYYAQKNRGAEAARADIVAFLDSDCRPCATWAETMVRHLRGGRPDLAGVQGTLTTDRTIQGLSFAVASFAQVQGRVARETAMLTGNNCAFRRAEFLADPFDEAPWFHGPEVKKIAALRHAGQHVMLDPGAEVRHAFYPGLTNFLTFSVYWGWCFLHLRRGNPTGVAYAGLFDGLGSERVNLFCTVSSKIMHICAAPQ